MHPDESLSLSTSSSDTVDPTSVTDLTVWSVLESNSYQNYSVLLDCSSYVYYESLQITVQFINNTQPLYLDISKNTLQIGNSNYTHILGSESSVTYYLDKDDELRSMTGVVYLRVGVLCTDCSGNITVTRAQDCWVCV